jgi:hypothetical protein
MNVSPWDRKLWGIVLLPFLRGDRPLLLGAAWDNHMHPSQYAGEASRVLLFRTRREARAWLASRHGKYAVDSMRVVRVRETVTVTD